MLMRDWVRLTTALSRPRSDNGQDMVEYALLCGLLTLVTLAAILLMGPYLRNALMDVANAINGHT